MLPPNKFSKPSEAAGTGGAHKCRGSGALNLNQHLNQPLCHAMWATACVFDVVANTLPVAINFLIFCTSSDGLAWVLGAGAVGFGFAAGVGNIYTGSGLFWGWAMALGYRFMGIG